MQSLTPSYMQDNARDGSWANHCEHCGASIFDGHLYARAGNPFSPKDAEAATSVRVHRIDAPFEAYYRMCWSEEYAEKQVLFSRIADADHESNLPAA